MENIIEPNDSFDFNQLSLAHPVGIQGGAYFTKIQNNNKPLYIQTPKSLTRQGFVKTGKKYYCDLMIDKNCETLVNWFENLEERCQKLIYEKSDTWFQTALEMSDVETAFNSVIRIYKSGKFYLIRTNMKTNSSTNEPSVKIYNEQEMPVNYTDINGDTNIISILEIQGIKFTSRNFQIDIELKQIMVLNNEPIFDSCLIKTKTPNKPNKIEKGSFDIETKKEAGIQDNLEETDIQNINNETDRDEPNIDQLIMDEIILDDLKIDDPKIDEPTINEIKMHESTIIDESTINEIKMDELKIEESATNELKMNESIMDENIELREVDPTLLNENDLDTFTLKKPNEVYFKIYKEAKNKAKQAKKSAILAYLEAKKIKKTYLLDNLNESDSEFEEEMDEVSESELEGL